MVKTNTKIAIISSELGTGNKITTTVTNVNSSASAAALIQFGRLLTGLTTSSYIETNKIVTTRLDDEEANNNG